MTQQPDTNQNTQTLSKTENVIDEKILKYHINILMNTIFKLNLPTTDQYTIGSEYTRSHYHYGYALVEKESNHLLLNSLSPKKYIAKSSRTLTKTVNKDIVDFFSVPDYYKCLIPKGSPLENFTTEKIIEKIIDRIKPIALKEGSPSMDCNKRPDDIIQSAKATRDNMNREIKTINTYMQESTYIYNELVKKIDEINDKLYNVVGNGSSFKPNPNTEDIKAIANSLLTFRKDLQESSRKIRMNRFYQQLTPPI